MKEYPINHHFNKYPDHPWLKTKEDIKQWLKENVDGYKEDVFYINSDLTVRVAKYTKEQDFKFLDLIRSHYNKENCDYYQREPVKINDILHSLGKEHVVKVVGVTLKEKKIKYIPVQFQEVEFFNCSNNELESLVGSPDCEKLLANNNKIKDFTGLKSITRRIELNNNRLINFKNMPIFQKNGIEVNISIINNKDIESFEGFTSCYGITLWKENYDENDILKIYDLKVVKNAVSTVRIPKEARALDVDVKLIRISDNYNEFGLSSLKSNAMLLLNKKNISESLKISKESRKRKI